MTLPWKYGTPSKYYRPKAIRKWASFFLQHGELSVHSQGSHLKRLSVLSDEDIKKKVMDYFRSKKPNQRTLCNLVDRTRRVIIPEALTVGPVAENVTALSEATMSKYLK